MTIVTRHNPAADLNVIVRHWGDLHAMLVIPGTADWPPAARMADHQRALSDEEQAEIHAEAAAERAERTAVAPGERPIPLRAAVLDTITAINGQLLYVADQVASSIQRPAITVPPSAGPADETGRALRLLATTDEADSRRWHWNGAGRDGRTAALWLRGRILDEDGPFAPLGLDDRERIGAVAAAARERVERTLGLARREDPIARRCLCTGHMVLRQGGALEPEVECQLCGTKWIGAAMAALVQQDQAA